MGCVLMSADTRLRIQDLLKQTKGMTQAKLSKELGISESTLSRFLSGETTKLGKDHIVNYPPSKGSGLRVAFGSF